jgi:hypothetical protein
VERRLIIYRVLDLLEARGPATAYSYMQRVGLEQFPLTLITYIRSRVQAVRSQRQRVA